MLKVFRQVYRRHAAPTELALDPVTIAQTGLQAIDQIQEWAPGVGLGDRPRALEWLEKAYARRVPYLVFLAVDPQFDAFRADPRFRDLIRLIGLPAGS
jgi:hypothetical protein